MAAELDYAYLARWARVNLDGTLTAVDASFVSTSAPGGVLQLTVAGRVRFTGAPYQAEADVAITVGALTVSLGMGLSAVDAPPYAHDRRHVLFALTTQIPVPEPGDCHVRISLDGVLVRELVCTVTKD